MTKLQVQTQTLLATLECSWEDCIYSPYNGYLDRPELT